MIHVEKMIVRTIMAPIPAPVQNIPVQVIKAEIFLLRALQAFSILEFIVKTRIFANFNWMEIAAKNSICMEFMSSP